MSEIIVYSFFAVLTNIYFMVHDNRVEPSGLTALSIEIVNISKETLYLQHYRNCNQQHCSVQWTCFFNFKWYLYIDFQRSNNGRAKLHVEFLIGPLCLKLFTILVCIFNLSHCI